MEQLLSFRLGGELYGLEIAHIQEIVEAPTLYTIPRAPEAMSGALNFHGSILPVLDLAAYLDFATGKQDARVLVLVPTVAQLVLAVTTLCRVVPFVSGELLPTCAEQARAACVRAVLEQEGEMINLLDLKRLLERLERS
ncbi:chemotaxis protein CheW [Trichloromonas sp.]|uniref:chemotaxis protein CheW n=1 Tax=Trichloromonas sp. TaxID=3069249 RepID=UPI002A3FE0B3|nr:chemotaxis protein CheW [Trichloromonas sp.]